ncbi:cobalamin B12-binding domain-containing protein [Cytobacillus gottheilii]|uniref:cobalamin B12-binding domain-containing protein n=1 Tax=Cytobacillus gottheilii TaxID=859144 RepID=UPI00082AAAFA|nr:cobalamin-dependent protein [Cytobacillus gottheilii]
MQEKIVKDLAGLMLKGDEHGTWVEISKLIDEGYDRLYIYEMLVTKVMRYIGELWEENEISVAEEHIASNVCSFVLSKVGESAAVEKKKSPGKVMMFCIEGEEHSLGLKMVHNVFKEHSWDIRFFGSNLPVHDAVVFANKWRPDVLCISISIVYNLPNLIRLVEQIDQLDYQPKIIVGGRVSTMYPLNDYLKSKTVVLKDLVEVNDWLVNNRISSRDYVGS